jgi:hypothetical protein
VRSSGSAGVGVESVWMRVGSSCRLANLNRRFRQVESTMVSSNRSRSHPASNCSQELLQNLRRCYFLLSSLFSQQQLRLLLIYFLPDPFCYPGDWKCQKKVNKWISKSFLGFFSTLTFKSLIPANCKASSSNKLSSTLPLLVDGWRMYSPGIRLFRLINDQI